jgi:DNA repair exonuclease SbcCD ATPase subunit
MPGRIQRGRRQDCPSCEYTGEELIHHLETNHPEVSELYVRARRGMWLLKDHDEYSARAKDRKAAGWGGDEKRDETVGEIREEVCRKERQIAEMEARLKERDERIEDLREARDSLFEILEAEAAVMRGVTEDPRKTPRDRKAAKG